MDDKSLCELVRSYPCIYDIQNEDYKNHAIRENAWKNIAKHMDRPVKECKKRWKNIRDSYNRKRKAIKSLSPSSAIHKHSKWELEDCVSFLSAEYDKKDSLTNAYMPKHGHPTTPQFINEQVLHDIFSNEAGSVFIHEDASTSAQRMNSSAFMKRSLIAYNSMHHTKKRKSSKKPRTFDSPQDLVNVKAEQDEASNAFPEDLSDKNLEDEHPIDAFFKSIALSVKKLPSRLQVKAKVEVLRIISELELEDLDTFVANTS